MEYETVERLKEEVYKVIENRVRAECEITLLEERSDLEKKCIIGVPTQESIAQRLEPIKKLRKVRNDYREQEMELKKQYRNACLDYRETFTQNIA